MEAKEVRKLMEAYASVYEGYGKKKGKKKIMHDCATHGEHAEWGMGSMIKEMHTLDEEGNITHYDVMFEHGIEKNVPVEDLTILEGEMHEHFVNDEKNAEVLGERSTDLFDYLLEYLVAEGYADTNKAALAIMANMSEEWKQRIVEADSVAAMRERAAKRRQQRYKGGPGGRDDFRPYTKDDYDNPKPGYGSGASSQAKDA